jgi:recombination protein RecT
MPSKLADKAKDARAAQQAGTAVKQKHKTIYEIVREHQPQFAAALPNTGVDAERFTRVAVTVLRDSKQLSACTPGSLLGALMICAQLGLEPGGPLGQAWLVPYKRECTFIVGYKGYIALALRSEQIASVKAVPVYDGDQFSWRLGLDEDITHVPTAAVRDDPDKLTHVYAVARFRDRAIDPVFVVLTRAEVDKFRARSKAKDNGPWVTDYVAMAQKTAVRRLSTWLPLQTELARASAVDEQVVDRVNDIDDFIDVHGEEVEVSGDQGAGTAAQDSEVNASPPDADRGGAAASTFACEICEGSGHELDDHSLKCAGCDGTGEARQ